MIGMIIALIALEVAIRGDKSIFVRGWKKFESRKNIREFEE